MKLNKLAFGMAGGILFGLGVFMATIILLLKGGEGEHVSLLRNFFFGYSFSYVGAVIGLVWGFVEGFIVGWLFAFVYNLFTKKI